MEKITRLTLTVLAVITLSFSGFSQKVLKKADAAFEAKQYYDAMTYYKQAYSSVSKDKRPTILYRMGVSAAKINDYKGAEANLNKAIAANFDNPEVYRELADVLKTQMKYPEAIIEYKNYKAKGGNAKLADLGVKSAELAQQWVDNPMRYEVENISLINSKQKDYAPCFADKRYKTLILTSNRDGSLGDMDANTGENKTDLWEAKLARNGKWSTPVLLPPSVSTEVNEGRAWVTKRGDYIFFTRCPEEKGVENKCGLYMCKKQGSTWGPSTKLPFVIDSLIFAHPTITADGKMLYFVSNMAGGYGKMDIWSCTFNSRTNVWGQPKNLGPNVNTPGNEVYPSVTDDGKRFYFASDYHPGLGGLDIFVTTIDKDLKFNQPIENLKYPLNSSYDDFSIAFEGRKQKGYFTSNREGGRGDDDVWSFYLPPLVFNVNGNVFSEGDPNTAKGKGETVEGVVVKVIGSNGSVSEMTTGKDGAYKFKLASQNTYTVSTETGKNSKSNTHNTDGFLANTDARVITTVGEGDSKDFVADFAVKPVVRELRLPEIQYELGSAELMASSKDSLNYLYNILRDNPSIVVELNAHTDSRGSDKENLKLSQARAQSCVDYLVKEKDVNPKRLVAKGKGEGELLVTDAVIKKASSTEEKEALHQKNRRTTFKVLNFDFFDPNAPKKPKSTKGVGDEDEEVEEDYEGE